MRTGGKARTLAVRLLTALCVLSASIAPSQADDRTPADLLMTFAGNIHQFNGIFPQEKVFIQFDNTSYYSGETIWFKAFVVNASDLTRAKSKVLYVDLISPTGVVLKQEKLKIVAGQADGSFPLIDGSTAQAREKRGVMGYPSGFYEVRAYTSYMLNFSEDALFSRVFAVYEKPDEDGQYYESNPVIKLRKPDLAEVRPETKKLRKINASFHPEGGHLIAGKPCRVAFKVTDDSGFGVNATGTVDNTDISFATVHDGMGVFTFTPQGKRSSVSINVDGDTRSFTLPDNETSGIVLHAEALEGDSLLTVIDPTPDFSGATLGMTVTCRGELMDFCTVDLSGSRTEKTFSMRGIPEGVCHLCLFDSNGTIYASRHFYNRNTAVKPPVLSVTPDRQSYRPFEKITLKFELADGHGQPFRDRFCLSVRDSRGQASVLADDLRTSMLLSSDIRGFIENPSWYFESDSPLRDKALDLLMMVQGWERYDWQTMTGQKEFAEVHRLEENLTLNGWILSTAGRKPLDNVKVLAATMPQDKTLSETYTYITDSTGYFGFDIGVEFYDKAKFSIDTRVPRERVLVNNARIKFDRSLFPEIRPYAPEETVFTPLSTGSGTQTAVKPKEPVPDDGLPTVIDTNTGYILPDVDIDEERMYLDYFTFNAFDVVKDVEIDLDKGDFSTDIMGYLIDKGFQVISNEDGGVETVNGFEPFFYVHDSKRFLNTGIFDPPNMIDTKDVVSIIVFERPMYMLNILTQCPLYQNYLDKTLTVLTGTPEMYTRRLLIDILIKEEHLRSTRKEIYNIDKRVTTVDGYSRPYAFYSPEYPDGPIPGDVDYRRTLYWNPNVVTDSLGQAQVELYNSSITRHINVSAAGITSGGIPYIFNQNY